MNKTEFIRAVADETGLTLREMTEIIDACGKVMTNELQANRKVSFLGFGTFEVKTRKGRIGKNPQTGKVIKINSTKLPTFKASKAYKVLFND